MKKRVIALVVLLSICMGTLTGYAEEGTGNKGSMKWGLFNYYAQAGVDFSKVSNEELTAFGVFLSNYIVPFENDAQKHSYSYFQTDEGKKVLYWGQADFEKDFKQIYDKLEQFRIGSMQNVVTKSDKGVYTNVTLKEFLESFDSNVKYYAKSASEESVLFDTSINYCKLGMGISLAYGAEILNKTYNTIKDYPLKVDGYGNLIAVKDNVDVIVLPAVLNPYVFSDTGSYLGVNNYTIANYEDYSKIDMHVAKKRMSLSDAAFTGKLDKKLCKNITSFNPNAVNLVPNASGDLSVSSLAEEAEINKALTGLIYVETNRIASQKSFQWSIINQLNISEDQLKTKNIDEYLVSLESHVNNFISSKQEQNVKVKLSLKNADLSGKITSWGWFDIFSNALGDSVEDLYKDINSAYYAPESIDKTLYQFDFTKGTDSSQNFAQVKDVFNKEVVLDLFKNHKDLLKGVDSIVALGVGSPYYDAWRKDGKGKYTILNAFIKDITFAPFLMNSDLYIYKELTNNKNSKVDTLNKNFAINMFYTNLKAMLENGKLNASLSKVLNSRGVSYFEEAKKLLLEKSKNSANNVEQDKDKMYADILQNVYKLTSVKDDGYRLQLVVSGFNDWVLNEHVKLTNSDASGLYLSQKNLTKGSTIGDFLVGLNLYELPGISLIMSNFNLIIIGFILLALVTLAIKFVVDSRKYMHVVLYTLATILVLVSIPLVMNDMLFITNSVTSKVYSNKYSYWAMTQYQQYLLSRSKASNKQDLLIVENIDNMKNTQSDLGTTLKWASPKKIEVFENLFDKGITLNNGNVINLSIFEWLSKDYFRQEVYTKDGLGSYLYRSYHDIAKAAKSSYDNYSSGTERIKNITGKKKYNYRDITKKVNGEKLFSRNQHKDSWMLEGKVTKTDVALKSYDLDLDHVVSEDNIRNKNEQFLLYSESVYYYFYNVIRDYVDTKAVPDIKLPDKANVFKGFAGMLLNQDKFFSYFNGEKYIVDYLDMQNLFTNVVPYLQAVNRCMQELRDSVQNTSTYKDYEKTIWGLYSPWADTLGNVKYKDNNQYSILKTNNKVRNAMDPANYVSREMVFSRYDANKNRIPQGDLTVVEQKTIKFLEKTYEDWSYLLNNAGYSEENFVATAALIATLNFNNIYSERGWLSNKDTIIYPLSLELRNFNYDAYMKLALMTSTGNQMLSSEELYSTILKDNSFFTALLLLLDDIVIKVVGIGKFIVTCEVFLLGLIMAILMLFKSRLDLKEYLITLIKPLGLYSLSALGYTCGLSLFLADSLGNLVGDKSLVIRMGNAWGVLGGILFVNLVFLVILFLISKSCFITLKTSSKVFKRTVEHSIDRVQDVIGLTKGSLKFGGNLAIGVGKHVYRRAMGESLLESIHSDRDIQRRNNLSTLNEQKHQTNEKKNGKNNPENNKYNDMLDDILNEKKSDKKNS